MRSSRITLITAAATALVLISGCDKEPTGQAVAVVNGEEISQSELNAELQFANVPENADRKQVMPQLLQRLVDRRLLAQHAVEQGIDRTPEYIAQQRRASEELLIRLLAERQAATLKVPTQAEIDKFITDNPAMFADRVSLALNQIRFDPPANPQILDRLKDDHSLDEIGQSLTELGIPFTTGSARLDTGTLNSAVAKQILALPPGEPFIAPSDGAVVASVIVDRTPVSVPTERHRATAAEAIRRQRLGEIMQRQLEQVKNAAKVEYQEGFAPAAKGATSTQPKQAK